MKDSAPVDCDNVDVQELERMGADVYNKVSDYMLNIDMTKAQFNVDMMVDEASKLGVDFGDLSEYGFDVKSAKCGGKTCFRKEDFKNANTALKNADRFGGKMIE